MFIYVNQVGNTKKQLKLVRKQPRGGFTTICPMPNTRPVPDSVEHVKELRERISETAKVRVTLRVYH